MLAASLLALALGVGLAPAAQAQNTNPTAVQGPNGEVPAPDKKPTPPLTFPPSSACAFHGKPDCEAKIRADAIENQQYGRTGVKGGAPATSGGEAFGSNASTNVTPLGGLSSGSSSMGRASAGSSESLGGISSGGSTNPQSIGNTSAGTPSPSGTGNGAPHLNNSGGSVGGSVPAGGGSSAGTPGSL